MISVLHFKLNKIINHTWMTTWINTNSNGPSRGQTMMNLYKA